MTLGLLRRWVVDLGYVNRGNLLLAALAKHRVVGRSAHSEGCAARARSTSQILQTRAPDQRSDNFFHGLSRS